MKTPMQQAIKMVQDYRKSGFADATTCNNILLHLGLILKEEKEVMVDFAYKCRNLMAGDEFAIAHWYDKTFDSVNSSDTAPSEAPSQSVK